jgi:phosphatidylinositol alpha-1,6-mannosyltransferase
VSGEGNAILDTPEREIREDTTARRVLLVTEWFLPHVGGSVNLFVNACSRYPEGAVHVLTGECEAGMGTEGPSSPLPTTRVSLQRYEFLKPESLLLYLRMTAAAIRLRFSFRPEILHCGHVLPEALVAWIYKKLFKVPYIVYVHGEEVAIQRHYKWKRRLMPRLYNAAAGVVANSDNSRQLLVDLGVDPKLIQVIHPGVELTRFRAERRALDGELRILSVSRLWPRKGHEQVLRALAPLKREFPQLRYWIAGTGGEEAGLRQLCRELGLDEIVKFLGYVPDEELPALYRQCDLFVLANRRLSSDDMEGFGIVFLEAAASGLPVVGGTSGGVPDAVNNGVNGILVDTEDIDALTGALRQLLKDDELRIRMGEASRRWAEGFSWERFASRVRQMSDQLAREASSK